MSKIRMCGEQAFLLDFDSVEEVIARHASIQGANIDGIIELVPAARTIFVEVDTQRYSLRSVIEAIEQAPPVELHKSDSPAIDIPMRYDGPDIPDVAMALGIDPDEVAGVHSGQEWVAAFTGFSPGFAYLVSTTPLPEVPRRPEPRTAVPTGAVAMAGAFTGIYPRPSPGGWQIIGHAEVDLWNMERPEPALITAGTRVRFVPL